MGYLVQIILALGALGLAESGFATGARLPLLVPVLVAVPPLLGWLARRALAAQRLRRVAVLSTLLGASPPALFLLALSVLGWHRSLADWTGSSGALFGWPDLSVFTVLTPFVLYQVSAIDARARLFARNAFSHQQARALQLRMFLSSLAPVALYVLISSAVGLYEPLRVSVEEVALVGALFSVFVLGTLALALPTVLRNTWNTVPFPGGLHRELLLRVAQRAGFHCRELLIWQTGNQMSNAAIIGIRQRGRYVLFSDALLAQLELRELAAVFGHEIGHAARKHVPVFVAWTIAFFIALGLLGDTFDLNDGAEPFALVGGALFFGYWGFGYMSRRFELDADLYSMDLLGDPEAMMSALEQVGGRLRDVAGWRHFSVADRVAFLRRASDDPEVGRKLRRTVRRFAICGFALLALTASIESWNLVSSWSRDQVHVDLRLGRYTSAAERLERSMQSAAQGESEERLRTLVAQARRLVDQGVVYSEQALTVERFTELARDAIADRDSTVALRLLELGVLRGGYDLIDPARTFEFLERGELERARALLSDLGPEWQAAIEPLLPQ